MAGKNKKLSLSFVIHSRRNFMLFTRLVNILGTEYKIKYVNYKDDVYIQKNGFYGYCDSIDKEITICNMGTCHGWENEPKSRIVRIEKDTLRHEIIHAFLNESGLQESASQYDGAWCKNEEMIDWIALQFPKILKVYKEVDAL